MYYNITIFSRFLIAPASTPYHIVTKQENLKEEEDVKNEIPTKTPLCTKVEAKNLKKAMLKKM